MNATTPRAVPVLPVFIGTPASSQIYGLAFDRDALWIKFKTGSVYRYTGPGVDQHYAAMMKAESVGKYFAANVKSNAAILYQRIEFCAACGAGVPPKPGEGVCEVCVPGVGEPPVMPPQRKSAT